MEMKNYIHDMKRTARYLTHNILLDDMDAGNTEFLKKAYDLLGLHGNRRILEKEPTGAKLAANISDHIFEDIIDVIMEEIFNKNNRKALDLLTGYYNSKFPDTADTMKFDADAKLFTEYMENSLNTFIITRNDYARLNYLLYGKNEANKKTIIRAYEKRSLSSEFIGLCPNIEDRLEKLLGIENLKSSLPYQKFLSGQRKKITDYLGIKYGGLEKFILKYADPRMNSSDIPERFKFIYTVKNFQNILIKHGISVAGAMKHEEKKCLDIIKYNFENLCNIRLLTKYCNLMGKNQETTLNEIISETPIEDPQAFLISLTTSFYYELLAIRLKEFMEESCKNFSIDRPAGDCREQELASENSILKAEIEKLKEKLDQQEAAFHESKRKHAKEAKKEIHEYEEQIRSQCHLVRQNIAIMVRFLIQGLTNFLLFFYNF